MPQRCYARFGVIQGSEDYNSGKNCRNVERNQLKQQNSKQHEFEISKHANKALIVIPIPKCRERNLSWLRSRHIFSTIFSVSGQVRFLRPEASGK